MYGFGVGFGLGEFGSGGFAVEASDATASIGGEAGIAADITLTTAAGALTASLMAASNLSIDPAGVMITVKKTRTARPPTVTAKPMATQQLRHVDQPLQHSYHISRNSKRDREH